MPLRRALNRLDSEIDATVRAYHGGRLYRLQSASSIRTALRATACVDRWTWLYEIIRRQAAYDDSMTQPMYDLGFAVACLDMSCYRILRDPIQYTYRPVSRFLARRFYRCLMRLLNSTATIMAYDCAPPAPVIKLLMQTGSLHLLRPAVRLATLPHGLWSAYSLAEDARSGNITVVKTFKSRSVPDIIYSIAYSAQETVADFNLRLWDLLEEDKPCIAYALARGNRDQQERVPRGHIMHDLVTLAEADPFMFTAGGCLFDGVKFFVITIGLLGGCRGSARDSGRGSSGRGKRRIVGRQDTRPHRGDTRPTVTPARQPADLPSHIGMMSDHTPPSDDDAEHNPAQVDHSANIGTTSDHAPPSDDGAEHHPARADPLSDDCAEPDPAHVDPPSIWDQHLAEFRAAQRRVATPGLAPGVDTSVAIPTSTPSAPSAAPPSASNITTAPSYTNFCPTGSAFPPEPGSKESASIPYAAFENTVPVLIVFIIDKSVPAQRSRGNRREDSATYILASRGTTSLAGRSVHVVPSLPTHGPMPNRRLHDWEVLQDCFLTIAPSSSGAEGDQRPSRESGFKLASNEYYWLSTTPAAARDTHAFYDYVAEPLTPPAGRGDQYFGNLNTGDIPMIIIRLRTLPPLNTTSNYTLFHIPLPQENPESLPFTELLQSIPTIYGHFSAAPLDPWDITPILVWWCTPWAPRPAYLAQHFRGNRGGPYGTFSDPDQLIPRHLLLTSYPSIKRNETFSFTTGAPLSWLEKQHLDATVREFVDRVLPELAALASTLPIPLRPSAANLAARYNLAARRLASQLDVDASAGITARENHSSILASCLSTLLTSQIPEDYREPKLTEFIPYWSAPHCPNDYLHRQDSPESPRPCTTNREIERLLERCLHNPHAQGLVLTVRIQIGRSRMSFEMVTRGSSTTTHTCRSFFELWSLFQRFVLFQANPVCRDDGAGPRNSDFTRFLSGRTPTKRLRDLCSSMPSLSALSLGVQSPHLQSHLSTSINRLALHAIWLTEGATFRTTDIFSHLLRTLEDPNPAAPAGRATSAPLEAPSSPLPLSPATTPSHSFSFSATSHRLHHEPPIRSSAEIGSVPPSHQSSPATSFRREPPAGLPAGDPIRAWWERGNGLARFGRQPQLWNSQPALIVRTAVLANRQIVQRFHCGLLELSESRILTFKDGQYLLDMKLAFIDATIGSQAPPPAAAPSGIQPPLAPPPHEQGLDYGNNAADIAADNMALHLAQAPRPPPPPPPDPHYNSDRDDDPRVDTPPPTQYLLRRSDDDGRIVRIWHLVFLNTFISHTAKLQEERIYVCGPASFRWPTSHQMPIRYEASSDPTTDKDLHAGSVLSAAMLERALYTVLGEEYRTDGVRQDRTLMRRAVEHLAADALLRIARLSARNAPFITHTTTIMPQAHWTARSEDRSVEEYHYFIPLTIPPHVVGSNFEDIDFQRFSELMRGLTSVALNKRMSSPDVGNFRWVGRDPWKEHSRHAASNYNDYASRVITGLLAALDEYRRYCPDSPSLFTHAMTPIATSTTFAHVGRDGVLKPLSSKDRDGLKRLIPHRSSDESLMTFLNRVLDVITGYECNDLHKHDECELFKGAGVEAMTAPSRADLDSLYSTGVSTWTCLTLSVVFDRLEDHKCSANLQYGTFIFSAELRNEFRNLFYRAWLFPHVVDPSLAKDDNDSADDNSPATRLYRWGQAMRRMLLKLRVELDHYVDNDRSRDILNVVIEERRVAFRPTFNLTRDKLIPKWLREVVTPALRCHLHHDVGLARLDTSNNPKNMLSEIVMSVCEGLPDGKRNEAHAHVKERYPSLLTGPIPRSGDQGSNRTLTAYFSQIKDLQQVRMIAITYAVWFEGLTAHERVAGLKLPSHDRTRPPRGTLFNVDEDSDHADTEQMNRLDEPHSGASSSTHPGPSSSTPTTHRTRFNEPRNSPPPAQAIASAIASEMRPLFDAQAALLSTIREMDKAQRMDREAARDGRQRQLALSATETASQVTASNSRPAQTRRAPSDLRPISDKYPINDYSKLLPAHRAKLLQYGITDGNHPRYTTKRNGCFACGSQYHPVGWCPVLLSFTELAGDWKEAYKQKLQARLTWNSPPTPLMLLAETEDHSGDFDQLGAQVMARLFHEIPHEFRDHHSGLYHIIGAFEKFTDLGSNPESVFRLRPECVESHE
ncbi:MAG: hypothetical protein CBC13_02145 [Planctomycetia bacterium TMED53]|nr:MAG: hypothetical protein CBC13_02145 [Planctomycetia bacterium TMED53]